MKRIYLIPLFLFLFAGSIVAEEQSYREAIEGLDPMDLTDIDPKVAGVLRKHYQYTYGDSITWSAVESLRMEGELTMGGNTFDYVAYQKKPNLLKVVVELGNNDRLVLAFDGDEAWQINPSSLGTEPVLLSKAEALNLERDSVMGGHLLYPQLNNKKFEFVGSASIEGDRVYELKITLPDGQEIRSFFDMTSFAELYRETTNNLNDAKEMHVYKDFRIVGGVRIPHAIILKVDGKKVHELVTTKLEVNKGVMPWVFSREKNTDLLPKEPGARGEARVNSTFEKNTSSFSIDELDIWSTESGVVGSAFQIDSVLIGEETDRSNEVSED